MTIHPTVLYFFQFFQINTDSIKIIYLILLCIEEFKHTSSSFNSISFMLIGVIMCIIFSICSIFIYIEKLISPIQKAISFMYFLSIVQLFIFFISIQSTGLYNIYSYIIFSLLGLELIGIILLHLHCTFRSKHYISIVVGSTINDEYCSSNIECSICLEQLTVRM